MTTYVLVFSDPVEGREEEYNDWYNNVHLREVVAVDGILNAQRFESSEAQVFEDQSHRYLAIYEIDESYGAKAVVENMLGGRDAMQMSDAMDLDNAKVTVVSSITDIVR